MTVYCYANLKVALPCQMKKMGTITAINFHVSLVEQQIFTVTYFRNNIYVSYHNISAYILLYHTSYYISSYIIISYFISHSLLNSFIFTGECCFVLMSLSTTIWSVYL